MTLKTSAICVLLAFVSTSALAQSGRSPMAAPGTAQRPYYPREDNLGRGASSELAAVQYRAALRDLRQEALALQASDGGTISPEHSTYIQERLDTLNARYLGRRRTR
jgi:hypothetical protein